jgi:hypothetical protein
MPLNSSSAITLGQERAAALYSSQYSALAVDLSKQVRKTIKRNESHWSRELHKSYCLAIRCAAILQT